jgi:hypothetical protein
MPVAGLLHQNQTPLPDSYDTIRSVYGRAQPRRPRSQFSVEPNRGQPPYLKSRISGNFPAGWSTASDVIEDPSVGTNFSRALGRFYCGALSVGLCDTSVGLDFHHNQANSQICPKRIAKASGTIQPRRWSALYVLTASRIAAGVARQPKTARTSQSHRSRFQLPRFSSQGSIGLHDGTGSRPCLAGSQGIRSASSRVEHFL